MFTQPCVTASYPTCPQKQHSQLQARPLHTSKVRKKTTGLDGCAKQRKRQKQTGSSDTTAEAFSKPAPAVQKQEPYVQAKDQVPWPVLLVLAFA